MIELLKCLFSILIIILLISNSNFILAQNTKGKESEREEKLKKRLETFLSFQTKRKNAKVYEMLEKKAREYYKNKDNYIKSRAYLDETPGLKFTDFQAPEFNILEKFYDYALIFGCGEFTENNIKTYYKSYVEAVYENDNWYFRSLIGGSIPLRECQMEKVKD